MFKCYGIFLCCALRRPHKPIPRLLLASPSATVLSLLMLPSGNRLPNFMHNPAIQHRFHDRVKTLGFPLLNTNMNSAVCL